MLREYLYYTLPHFFMLPLYPPQDFLHKFGLNFVFYLLLKLNHSIPFWTFETLSNLQNYYFFFPVFISTNATGALNSGSLDVSLRVVVTSKRHEKFFNVVDHVASLHNVV